MDSNRKAHKRAIVLAIVASAVGGVFVPVDPAQATDPNGDLVYPPSATIAGQTYEQWAATWWQYIFSIPNPANPTNDTSGALCDVAQRGPVWFLAGSPSQHAVSRTCTIHAQGRPIFFPIINLECSTQDLPAQQYPDGFHCTDGGTCSTCAGLWGQQLDPSQLKASVDGHDLTALYTYLAQSAPFQFQMPANNVLGTGRSGAGTSVTSGYWLMLKPLSPGHHTVHFEGGLYGNVFHVNVTYELNVVP